MTSCPDGGSDSILVNSALDPETELLLRVENDPLWRSLFEALTRLVAALEARLSAFCGGGAAL